MIKKLKENVQNNIGYIDFNDLVDVLETLKSDGYHFNVFCRATDQANYKYLDKFRRLVAIKLELKNLRELYKLDKIIIKTDCTQLSTDEFESVDDLCEHPICFYIEPGTIDSIKNEFIKKYSIDEINKIARRGEYPFGSEIIKKIFDIDINLLKHLTELCCIGYYDIEKDHYDVFARSRHVDKFIYNILSEAKNELSERQKEEQSYREQGLNTPEEEFDKETWGF